MKRVRLLVGISVFWLALSMLFDGVNSLVLPRRILDLAGPDRSATVLGLMSFAGLLLALLVQPVAGQWSDRLAAGWGRRGFIALGLALILLALLGFGAAGSILALAAAYLALQAATAVAQAGQQGFIPDLAPREQRGVASGLKGLMDTGGAMAGFLLLALLLGGGSIAPALLVIAVALVVTYLLTVILVREPTHRTVAPAAPAGLAGAFRIDVRRHSTFVALVLARFLFLFGTYAVGRFLLYFVAQRLGLPPDTAAKAAGGLLAGLTLLTALAAPLGGWAADRYGRMPLMVAGCLVSAAGALGLIWADTQAAIFACGALMALGSAAFASANWALTSEVIPQAEAARFMGLANFGTAGGAAAAGLLGLLVDWGNRSVPGQGYVLLFLVATLAYLAAPIVLRGVRQPRTSTVTAAVAEDTT